MTALEPMSARKRLTKAAVISSLGELAAQEHLGGEVAHPTADDLLLAYVPDEVRAAYEAVVEAADFWAHA